LRSAWRIARADRRRGQPRGRDLIEQRLEEVVVGAVDEDDLDRRLRQRAHRLDAAEAAADDEDPRPCARPLAGRDGSNAGSIAALSCAHGELACCRILATPCDSCSSKTTG
jgi:hypothetical protein